MYNVYDSDMGDAQQLLVVTERGYHTSIVQTICKEGMHMPGKHPHAHVRPGCDLALHIQECSQLAVQCKVGTVWSVAGYSSTCGTVTLAAVREGHVAASCCFILDMMHTLAELYKLMQVLHWLCDRYH